MRTTRPLWPTHRAKRHRLRYVRQEPEPRPPTPGQMAADLVRRGLASEAILDPRPLARNRSEGAA